MHDSRKQIQDDSRPCRGRPSKPGSIYACSYCRYESRRTFNVERHMKRIHTRTRLNHCCGQTFFTKGNYYIHCEKYHPMRRIKAITSQTKYKITGDLAPSMHSLRDEDFDRLWGHDSGNTGGFQFERRYSQRIREKMNENVVSRLSLTYKLIYSDWNVEDIPLICFLKDRQLRTYMKQLSALPPINKSNEKGNEKAENAKESVDNVDISSSPVVETTVPENDSPEETNINSCRLPAKKLLLHRFKKNVSCKFEIPFREQNNNYPGQVNFAEARESVSVIQNWSANCKRGYSKENLSTLAFSFEQQLHVNLDGGIAGPVITEQHRDFLASIDFDNYKIF
ncbi:uncharacterized protein LOC144467563 [Augochlora pura]